MNTATSCLTDNILQEDLTEIIFGRQQCNIEINGHVATRQAVPDFNLKAVVRNFRPNDLNLTDQYKDTDMSLNLTATSADTPLMTCREKSVLTAYRSRSRKRSMLFLKKLKHICRKRK